MGIDIISLLSTDGYIMCNKTLIKLYGADCAILVGELCAEYNYYKSRCDLTPANSFYSTQENIEANTGLNSHYQRKALKVLQDAEIIKVTKQGLPARNYYWINTDKLCEIFTASPSSGEGLDVNCVDINNNKVNNNKDNYLAQHEFNFGVVSEESKRKTNQNEYTDALLLINAFSDDNVDLKCLLVQLLDNRVEMCSKQRHHFYASTFKHYLDELSKINDKIGAVKLSLQYNNTLKVMEPNKSYISVPDTNTATQVKYNSDEERISKMARNSDGTPMTF